MFIFQKTCTSYSVILYISQSSTTLFSHCVSHCCHRKSLLFQVFLYVQEPSSWHVNAACRRVQWFMHIRAKLNDVVLSSGRTYFTWKLSRWQLHVLAEISLLWTLFLFNTIQALDSSSICILSSIQLSGVMFVHTQTRTCINSFMSKDVQWKVYCKSVKGSVLISMEYPWGTSLQCKSVLWEFFYIFGTLGEKRLPEEFF